MGDYRNDARRQLKRAQDELASGDDQRLQYAALELREAMESLTYDRAAAYKDDFPPSEYETWQPKKVMLVILEIDPKADKDSTLAFGLEPSLGEQPEVMHLLGTEKVLNMATLKKHYDALGSYLHVPTLKQRRVSDKIDYAAMRKRCNTIAAFIDGIIKSPVWNATIGNVAIIDCAACGKPVRKRWPTGKDKIAAKCFECGESYIVEDIGGGQVRWQPDQVELACANVDCGAKIFAARHQVEVGRGWDCRKCGGRNEMRLGVAHLGKMEPPVAAPTA